MNTISTHDRILRVEGRETKFDIVTVSNSLVALLGSYEEAIIVQQIHSWTLDGRGIEIDKKFWFDKSIKDWITEVVPTASDWKMRSYLASLVDKGVLERKHLYKEHHGHNYSPKNRTYYYRLDYEKLSELARRAISNSNNAGGEE
ncbi:hypothetical protein Sta7437_4804 (plasmid) [Stanieria cyanosphaera PCC 7437]|uniref:Uncharacterized protein n=1 Tax=Stanieria cyanosphaera (strain ATCC 29371 / PCC 7437) TaxID=111780 RepID=K9Y2J7_STAC7|nr:hypothetical protein [Stanieria cyanosphaera]AFZ38242.1 hypothetical protein Sta7437_4804 [Stanieria cyanosphaera PCC 7437]